MTLNEAIEILENYNKWRTGSEVEIPSPRKITEALNIAIHQLKQLK
jgi:hypothetical protein